MFDPEGVVEGYCVIITIPSYHQFSRRITNDGISESAGMEWTRHPTRTPVVMPFYKRSGTAAEHSILSRTAL